MKFFRIPAVLALVALLAACAGAAHKAEPPKTPEQVLTERAQQRWNLLIAGDFAAAWEYLSPGYKSIAPRDLWAANMAGRPVEWKSAKVNGVECPEGEAFCDVTVTVDFLVQSTLPGVGKVPAASPVIERWIGEDGAWFFVPKEVANVSQGLR